MSLVLKSNNYKYLKYFTALFACAHYFYYSELTGNFNFYNIFFIFTCTVFTYQYLQVKSINYLFLFLSILTLILFRIDNILGLILSGAITSLYEYKFRKIIWLKPLSIALSWTLLIKFNDLIFFIESFLLVLALSIPFDIRDFYEDKKSKLQTLVTRFNPKSVRVFCLLIWISFVALKLQNSSAVYTLVISILYIGLLFKISPKSSRAYTYIFLDSILLLQAFSIVPELL